MENPYLAEWKRQKYKQEQRLAKARLLLRSTHNIQALGKFLRFKEENGYVHKYAWAIPNEEAILCIRQFAPLIEIGAGTGYWGWMLKQLGTDVICYDSNPPNGAGDNPFHPGGKCWTTVVDGNESVLDRNIGRTLFLCWPPPHDPMAYRTLSRYSGDTFIYVGELPPARGLFEGLPVRGSCADRAFDILLDAEWSLQESSELPNWDACWSTLSVFRRRRGSAVGAK